MSQALSDSSLVAALQAEVNANYLIFGTTALTAYEYVITIKQEVNMVWRRKWILTTWIFMANRYLLIGNMLLAVIPTTSKSCPSAIIFGDILYLAQNVVYSVFSALRVFALSDHNILLTIIVLLLGLAPVPDNIIHFWANTAAMLLICLSRPFFNSIGLCIAFVLGGILVLAVTWRKTFKHRLDAARIGMQTPLSSLLLRDGTVYFIVLLIMNIAQVLTSIVPALQIVSPVDIIGSVLQPILISRFLLNLRGIDRLDHDTNDHNNDSGFSVPGFRFPTLASIIGNMGADLDHGPVEEADSDAIRGAGSSTSEEVVAEY